MRQAIVNINPSATTRIFGRANCGRERSDHSEILDNLVDEITRKLHEGEQVDIDAYVDAILNSRRG